MAQLAGAVDDERYVITPEFKAVIYEQGLALEPLDDPWWPY